MYSRIEHILCHKVKLNKFKKIEIISSNLSDYNSMKLEISQGEKREKNEHMETKYVTKKQNKTMGHNEIKEIRKYLKTNEKVNTTLQNRWDTTKAVLRGMFTVIEAFLKKHKKYQINSLNYH